ncbi:MAG: hypothetical protein ABGW78_00660, partial [Pirellulales bacterium]
NAAEVQVQMDEASTIPQIIDVSTQAITATLGTDYMHRNQKVIFFPGETVKSIFVQSLVDPVNTTEGPETLNLIITPVGGSPSQLTREIIINDYVTPVPYNIEFNFDGSVPSSVQLLFDAAAKRWENVIVGDLPDVTDPTTGVIIDDLLINVTVSSTLPATTIAQASIGDIRVGDTGVPANGDWSTNGLPYIGSMEINDTFLTAVGLPNTIAHEMGHVIGFGNLWADDVGTFQTTLVANYDPATTDPIYIGENGVTEYKQIFITGSTSVPLYNVGTVGDGSYGVHWRDSVFNSLTPPYVELMTANYDVDGIAGVAIPAYLSRITVGVLDDLGYDVNYEGAEFYVAPSTSSSQVTLSRPSSPSLSVHAGTPSHGTMIQTPILPVLSKPTTPTATPAPSTRDQVESARSRIFRGRAADVRRLPPRLTFPDHNPIVLSDNDASREFVLKSLAANETAMTNPRSDLLRRLSSQQKHMLMAWATFSAHHQTTDDSTTERTSETSKTAIPFIYRR